MFLGINTELVTRAGPLRHDARAVANTNSSTQLDFGTSLMTQKNAREKSSPEHGEEVAPDTAPEVDALMPALSEAFDSKIVTHSSQEARSPQEISGIADVDTKVGQSLRNLGGYSESDSPPVQQIDRNIPVSPATPAQALESASMRIEPNVVAHRKQRPLGALDANTMLTVAPSLSAARTSARSLTTKPSDDARLTTVVDDPSRAVKLSVDEADTPRLDGSATVSPVEGLDLLEPDTTVSDVSKILHGEGAAGRQGTTEGTSSPIQIAPLGVSAPSPILATTPSAMTSALGLVTATPNEVVDIISDALLAPEDRRDRVTVQLNPVELGRVSVDFKFDSQGLTHVTITGETPEAVRQLRALHFELVNALEREGLAGQSMTFQQEQREPEGPSTDLKSVGIMTATELEPRADVQTEHIIIANGSSLNIKV